MWISCERLALVFLALALPWIVSSKPEAAGGPGVESAAMIPPGTIIPVRLDKPISIRSANRGQAVEAKVAQMVPLSTGEKIALRATMRGSIVSVETDPDGPGVKLTLKFDQLEDHKNSVAIATYLRAIASLRAVQSAQLGHSGVDIGTPNGWADTVQIGGDVRFGDGGAVRNRAKQQVGKGVAGGVLVHVSANPTVGCEGPVGSDYPQALWVFSADACGAYDLQGVKVAQTGRSSPATGFTLHFEPDVGKLEAGTAMLLRIAPKP